MVGRTFLRALPLLITGFLIPGSAWAVYPPPIKDDGKFFSREGLDKANLKIRQIYEKYKKDVIIETMSGLTAEQDKKLAEDGKTPFFARMAREKSMNQGLNGIYIMILRKPQHLQVHMDPETQKKMFTVASRKQLIEKISEQFRDGSFDAGLLEGLESIESTLKSISTVK
ncbi:MAG: TPM domain-containing protein [Gemmataceae bacterium]